jgi:hypothetical protein
VAAAATEEGGLGTGYAELVRVWSVNVLGCGSEDWGEGDGF